MHARQLQLINRRQFVCNGICIKQSIDMSTCQGDGFAPFPVFPLTLTQKVAWDESARAILCYIHYACSKLLRGECAHGHT